MATLSEQLDQKLAEFATLMGNEMQAIQNQIGDLTDLNTLDKSDLVAAINEVLAQGGGGANAILSDDLKATLALGGIDKDQVFLASTPLETLWRELLIKASISNLTLNNGYAPVLEVGSAITTPIFSWNEDGTPENLLLDDNVNIISDVSVSDGTYISGVTYQYDNYQTVTWTLRGSNVPTISRSATWVRPFYTGIKNSKVLPTEAEVLAGTKHVALTNSSVSEIPNTDDTDEYFWFAIPEADGQSKHFTSWSVSTSNSGSIADGNFIEDRGLITVSGVQYRIYMYGYPSGLNETLTLR